MAQIRAELYKTIKENDLNQVIFVDPFTETSRKAKRYLIVSSFIALMISVLKLEITGFLGLQASQLKLGNELAQGLACAAVIYFFLVFIYRAYIDYTAWQFQRERQLTKPYLDLINIIENSINVTELQVKNAVDPLSRISIRPEMKEQKEVGRYFNSAVGQLNAIDNRLKELVEETRPLLVSWKTTIDKMNHLNWRLRVRFIGLWGIEILFPLALSIFAIAKTYQGLKLVAEKVAS